MQKRQKVILEEPVKYRLFLGSRGKIYSEYSINFRDIAVPDILVRSNRTLYFGYTFYFTLYFYRACWRKRPLVPTNSRCFPQLDTSYPH
ncbi:hypothetical protein SAMN05421739_10699 [Pontibacter chinhatensis]|uniref:Uncharacterized protein n=1 Tax=Pontibacter chinhatensis TaxID=1436961 RepID=A0A1I2XL60_9BACT|nr:hypothetical protein SAMN05421739_10699 [Pontibacter chinhatensis]